MKKNLVLKFALLATAVSLLFTLPASAQDDLEEIVVTGSYITRPADRPQPVTVLEAADIANEQRSNLGEIFMDLGISQGGSALNSSPNTPTSTVNLRGIGTRGTLVMLNGRRQTTDGLPGAGGAAGVDVNNLAPAIMLERVEVLTDGASALYGSDAVAGVVNLITRRNFEGAEVSLRGMEVDRAGDGEFQLGAIFGTSTAANTSIVAGFEYTERGLINTEHVFEESRLRTSALSPSGNPGSFTPVSPEGQRMGPTFPDPLCGSEQIGGGLEAGFATPFGPPGSRRCRLQLSLGRNLVASTERLVGLAVIDHSFGDNLDAQVDFGFARGRFETNFGYGLPINVGEDLKTNPIVPAYNPGIIAENARSGLPIQDYTMNHRVLSPSQGIPQSFLTEQDTYRVGGVLNGQINDNWNWAGTATFSQNDSLNIRRDVIAARISAALRCEGLASRDGCYNPFANAFLASPGDPEYNSPEMYNWVLSKGQTDGHAQLTTLDFLVTGTIGELAGGPTGLALGLQTRDQTFGVDFDPINEDGANAFRPLPQPDYQGDRTADAIFAEVVLFPTETLEVQLAVRNEAYGGGIDSTDPKIGLLWTPTPGLFIRATAGTAFRIAGELQAFGQTLGRFTTVELRPGELIDAGAIVAGNLNLLPEESENFTLGMTWDVTDNFTFDLNYWKIDFRNLVVADDGNTVLLNDIADGFIDDPRILLRAGVGNEVATLSGADIVGANLSYRNQDFLNTDGIDFNFNYNFDAGGNNFRVNLTGTNTLSYEFTTEGAVIDGVGFYNHSNLGVPMPDFTAVVRFDWQRGDHYARIAARHIPEVKEDTSNPRTQSYEFTTIDLGYTYTFGPDGRGNASIAVANATDEETPIDGTTLSTNASSTWDPRGRLYRIGAYWAF